jgi:integrase
MVCNVVFCLAAFIACGGTSGDRGRGITKASRLPKHSMARSMLYVRDRMGHSSVTTTSVYYRQ